MSCSRAEDTSLSLSAVRPRRPLSLAISEASSVCHDAVLVHTANTHCYALGVPASGLGFSNRCGIYGYTMEPQEAKAAVHLIWVSTFPTPPEILEHFYDNCQSHLLTVCPPTLQCVLGSIASCEGNVIGRMMLSTLNFGFVSGFSAKGRKKGKQ